MFHDEAREVRARQAGEVLGDTLKAQGGLCEVSNGDGFVDVTLKDGRMFQRAGVHGSGGIISARYGADRVRREWRNREHLVIYLVSAWWGDIKLTLDVQDIVSIEASA